MQSKSLPEVNSTVLTENKRGFGKKLFAFIGPAYLVSVGYMDPGNWATDLAGGSSFGYKLLWVLLMSNLMALLLQSLSARLGLVRGLDLAQASRANYPKTVNFFNWLLAEIAIAACDLAEVVGMAIGLQLLFGVPLIVGVSITVLDTFLLLFLQKFGIRKIESLILILIATIGFAFIFEMIFAQPSANEIFQGFVPGKLSNSELYIAIGIIGATVMPHNLYLHSSLVQTRKIDRSIKGIREAIKYNFIDSFIALNMALFINAAILILAASAFYKNGLNQVSEIQDAYHLLENILGTYWAPTLFAVALIAAGQSSTLTGTLSGQIVMEGYLNIRLQPWLRRLITRLVAIIPAFLTILILGEGATGKLLILSQVILSLQLGFAVIPLIHFTSDKKQMGEFANKLWVKITAWLIASVILILNIRLVIETVSNWINQSSNPWILYFTVLPILAGAAFLLLYITFAPVIKKKIYRKHKMPDGSPEKLNIVPGFVYSKIAVTVDFSRCDSDAINNALLQGGKNAIYTLIHIVETAGARMMGNEINDFETGEDLTNLEKYKSELEHQGYKIEIKLGFGNPKKSIAEIVNKSDCELLVMGAHGHRAFKDLLFGTTLDSVRHNVKIPVLIVKKS